MATLLLGNNAIAGNRSGLGASDALIVKFTAVASGTLDNIQVYISATGGIAKVGCYSDNAGSPNALLTESSPASLSATGWKSFAVPSIPITSGTVYWLAVINDTDTTNQYAWEAGGANQRAIDTATYPTFENPASPSSFANQTWSMFGENVTPVLRDNLSAYYKLDSNSNDSVGTKNGTDTNSPTYTPGKISNGLTLVRASSMYVTFPNSILPWGTNTYTVNMWVKLADTSSNQSFTMVERLGKGLNLYLAGGSITHSKPNVVDLNYSWTADTDWHMWTFVGDGSGMRTYLDGNPTPVASNANTSNLVNPDSDTITFGAYKLTGSVQAGWYMDGKQDEVGIWNRALSTTEINILFRGGLGSTYPFLVTGNLLQAM